MKTKTKRIWSDEQRAAARDRMAKARSVRQEKLRSSTTAIAELSEQEGVVAGAEVFGDRMPDDPKYKVRDPEVQAVLDTMTPERKAKLADIQRRVLSTPDAQAAIARHEAEKAGVAVADESRVGVRDVMLRVSSNGTMASLLGPCVCGRAKREWHNVH